MEVVAYLHNADLLLEDEQGVAVIGGSYYVLSLGDRVFFVSKLMHLQRYIKFKFHLPVQNTVCCMKMKFNSSLKVVVNNYSTIFKPQQYTKVEYHSFIRTGNMGVAFFTS